MPRDSLLLLGLCILFAQRSRMLSGVVSAKALNTSSTLTVPDSEGVVRSPGRRYLLWHQYTPPPMVYRCVDSRLYDNCFQCGKICDNREIFYDCCQGTNNVVSFCDQLLSWSPHSWRWSVMMMKLLLRDPAISRWLGSYKKYKIKYCL